MLKIVPREEWDAEEPEDREPIEHFPVETVLVMYTQTDPCLSTRSCIKAIKDLQKRQMDEGLPDIQWK